MEQITKKRTLDAAISSVIALLDERPVLILGKPVWIKQKRACRCRSKLNLEETSWVRLIRSHEIWIHDSFEAKKFRSRFRLPWILFKKFLLPLCKSVNMFNKERKSYISLEIKLLIALRMLGKGNDCDTLEELSGIPKSTVNNIFNQFCDEMTTNFFTKYVYMPEGEEREKIMDVFARVGFPGACGSMDVTHVRWYRCPRDQFNNCKGKYPFTTLATQAVVDHNRRILFLSDLYDGRENDKTITMDDEYTYNILHGSLNEVQFKMYDADGVEKLFSGGYLIVDGGYMKLPCLIDPMHDATGLKDTHWSEFLESVRKDVECAFGILKSRFRILRNGLECSRTACNNVVKTCAILHNMLLVYDGLHEFKWEKNSNWAVEDPDMSDDALRNHVPKDMEDNELNNVNTRHRLPRVDTTMAGRKFISIRAAEYPVLRRHLVEHFHWQWVYNRLDWPKRFDSSAKRSHPMNRIKHVMIEMMSKTLYKKPADVVMVRGDKRYSLGDGLFSNILLPAAPSGITIAEYKGELISLDTVKQRTEAGFGGYIVALRDKGNALCYLDCYKDKLKGLCKASCANSALNGFNIATQSLAVNNLDLILHGGKALLKTKPKTSIPPHRELLVAYQQGYRYPSVSNMKEIK
jgi:hypothetical protein